MKKLLILSLLALSNTAMAFDSDEIYFGGGLSSDAVNGTNLDGNSIVVFGGTPLDYDIGEFTTAFELGYIMLADVDGCSACDLGEILSFTGLASMEVADQINVLGRVGYLMALEDGVDSEVQFGAGAEYVINDNFSARGEYLIAGDLDSMAFTLKYTR